MVQKVKSTITGTMDQIIATVTDEEFCRTNATQTGGQFTSLDVSGNLDDAFSVTTKGLFPISLLPDNAKKFLGSDIPLEYVQRWGAPAADGSREAEITITVKNGLVSVTGTQTFTPDNSDVMSDSDVVVSVFTGVAKANIPLVGNKIAAMIEPKFAQTIKMQSNAITEWITKRHGANEGA